MFENRLRIIKNAIIGAVFMIAACCVLCGCTRKQAYTFTTYAFDTVLEITYWGGGSELQTACTDLCNYYEDLFSRTIDTSDISRINHANGEPVVVDPETTELIREALEYSRMTDGAFDITTLPLSLLWDVNGDHPSVPEYEAVMEARGYIGYHMVKVSGNTVTLQDPQARIDLGGIAKGYISKKILELLIGNGIEHALINLGGNVVALGGNPDGDAYHIGIQEPFGPGGRSVTSVDIKDGAVVTSGSYQRYFEADGIIYHHIMDPETGFPARSGLNSVTVICDDPVQADAFSTALYVMGYEKGTEFLNSMPDVHAIFLDEDNQILN